ncbi:unnamed protein product [Parascedosporium putredinis]|uniref:tRNA (guanine(9)-N1)-methyltransferase n=1 Tax=Parascedosporium putredinis TaxID=1442378 RepID=A0A9P1HC34_9PEZI|nr:unnamed protein product [Parascedosporium putredinis]CAI8003961.1 unnamed protein product [Parascedosporium putredinis]
MEDQINELSNGAPAVEVEAGPSPPTPPNHSKPAAQATMRRLPPPSETSANSVGKRSGRRYGRASETYAAAAAEARAAGLDPKIVLAHPKTQSISVPISIIIDCSFESYMVDKELVSLSSQIQRAYSENRAAEYRPHLFVSSWGGKIKNRYEVGMNATHQYWKGIRFIEGDILDASKEATELEDPNSEPETVTTDTIVYLSSDSPYILERLEPGTSYVIGGIVDKNREKGLCHRLARKRGIRTAKLPIKEYMVMNSRQVLATNHVVEIMLRWLECGDWGAAFLKALPKRKEAKLRDEGSGAGSVEPEEERDAEDEEGDEEDAEGDEEAMADAPTTSKEDVDDEATG